MNLLPFLLGWAALSLPSGILVGKAIAQRNGGADSRPIMTIRVLAATAQPFRPVRSVARCSASRAYLEPYKPRFRRCDIRRW